MDNIQKKKEQLVSENHDSTAPPLIQELPSSTKPDWQGTIEPKLTKKVQKEDATRPTTQSEIHEVPQFKMSEKGFQIRVSCLGGQYIVDKLTEDSKVLNLKLEIAKLGNKKPEEVILRIGYPPTLVTASDDTPLSDLGIYTGESVIAEFKYSYDSKEESKAQDMESKKSTFFYPREQKPTHIKSPPWIYEYDPKYEHFEGGGKWMLFYPKTELDEKWDKIKKHYRNGELVGIQSLKVSTNFENPRSSSKTNGVIICYCGRPDDKEKVMKYGKNLVKLMGYTNSVSYKSDEQTKLGTTATGNKNNSLYTIRID